MSYSTLRMFDSLSKKQIIVSCLIILLDTYLVNCSKEYTNVNTTIVNTTSSSINDNDDTYEAHIPHRLTYGDTVSILGRFLDSTQQIDVSFSTYAESRDIALLISFKMNERKVLRNSHVNGKWGREESFGGFPLNNDGLFDMTVYFFDDYYHIVIGADHFCRFPVRVPLSHTTYMVIVGLSEVENVVWDQGCKC